MINTEDYENAKVLIAKYEEQQNEKKALVCTLRNIELRRGADGHWLSFTTLLGRHSVINIENCFEKDTITHANIRQWAYEQDILA